MQTFTKNSFWRLFDRTFISDVDRATKDINCHKCKTKIKNTFNGMARPLHFYPLLCAIDYLRYFKFGGKKNNKKQYKEIVNEYLRKYNADFLYSKFRCGLIHQLQISTNRKTYIFTDDCNKKINTRQQHLKEIEINIEQQRKIHVVVFNLREFVEDIKKTAKDLIDKIFNQKDINTQPYNRCAEWYRNFILSKKTFNKNNLDIQFFSI